MNGRDLPQGGRRRGPLDRQRRHASAKPHPNAGTHLLQLLNHGGRFSPRLCRAPPRRAALRGEVAELDTAHTENGALRAGHACS